MFGYIKGYNVCAITKKNIEKEGFLEELAVTIPSIKEKILNVLENQGLVYGLVKEKVLKAVYLFDAIKEEKKTSLKYVAEYHTEDTKDAMEEFKKATIEGMQEKVTLGEYTKVEWDDIEIEPNSISKNGLSVSYMALGISVGILYGIIFHNIAVGFCLGVAFGACFGAAVKKKE